LSKCCPSKPCYVTLPPQGHNFISPQAPRTVIYVPPQASGMKTPWVGSSNLYFNETFRCFCCMLFESYYIKIYRGRTPRGRPTVLSVCAVTGR
jgi:hypothetical protein